MKITNMKTVYFSEKEIKEALICYMQVRNPFVYNNLATHMRENRCSYDWETKEGQMSFVVSIDGEVIEEPPHLDIALKSPGIKVAEYEETIELHTTYGGD
tara:strand:+ start:1440 stop:1739 length:300 start_codon:yes stop_codon:yes gene_type:complete